MSTGPALLSRRSLLRGAASVTVLAAFAAISSCATDPAPTADAPDGSSLLRLGHSIVGGRGASAGTSGTNATAAPTGDGAAMAAIDAAADAVQADFAQGRTVVAEGWLLSATEAEVLASYAGACPLPAC